MSSETSVSLKLVSPKMTSFSSLWGQYWAHLTFNGARDREEAVRKRTNWQNGVRVEENHSQILSLWLGSASRRRGSAAPTPSPRSCHMCLEGVPEKERRGGFILSITKKDQGVTAASSYRPHHSNRTDSKAGGNFSACFCVCKRGSVNEHQTMSFS